MSFKNQITSSKERSDLLARVISILEADKRVMACWLYGSYARGEEDDYSDLDISVVVFDKHAGLVSDWKAFIGLFGNPANQHEAKQNAPRGGTMISTLYDNGFTIDWILIPERDALRPYETRVLFEKKPVTLKRSTNPLSEDEIQAKLADRLTYFWMMAAVTTKSIHRNQAVQFHVFLNILFWTARDIEALSSKHVSSSLIGKGPKLEPKQGQQSKALELLCEKRCLTSARLKANCHTK